MDAGSLPEINYSAQSATLHCVGAWTIANLLSLEKQIGQLSLPKQKFLTVQANTLTAIDTAGAWLLYRMLHQLELQGCSIELKGLASAHESIYQMIAISAKTLPAGVASIPLRGWVANIGYHAWKHVRQMLGILNFIGEIAQVTWHVIKQPSRIRWRYILRQLQTAGFNALPITGLLAFLVGIVISYQGADRLHEYGADIFIVDLVGLSLLRELAPLLTAVIIAGRSGSAYAAEIGTMKITEEIDALRTIGIVPIELLVLPKIVALMLALPLLTVFADMMGIFGGMVMAKTQLGIGFLDFADRFSDAVSLSAYLIGIGKAPVFAAIIATIGCFQGFEVWGGADSVGKKTTLSVVQAIFLVIITDAFFSVVLSWLNL